MSKKLEFVYDILLVFDSPVEYHSFVLRCLPPSFSGQEIIDVSLVLEPNVSWSLQKDAFGNSIESGRIDFPHNSFRYGAHGTAIIDVDKREKEKLNPIYKYQSAYTHVNDEMRAFISSLSLDDDLMTKAWQIADAVHNKLEYIPGSTGVFTKAGEAFSRSKGVCQDFAHVYLSIARESGIPARYVNGMTEGEGETHAWCEVYIDGIWKGIDPTGLKWCDSAYIRFNIGRDFSDCPIERGVFTGLANQKQIISTRVTEQ